jgi:diguanylate cyclase (GGDEF)-like protein
VFMVISAVSSVFGIILTVIFYTNLWYILVFVGPIVCVSVNGLLAWRKLIRLYTASFVTMLYNSFIFIPSLWLVTGIKGAAPMTSLIILVAIMTLFSGKTLKWLLAGFFLMLLALTVYDSLIQFPVTENTISLVYIIAAYWTTSVLIMLYMLSKQREFDELNDKFLRSSFKDELTQLYNRKLLDIIIEYVESLYKREHQDYILVMFDIDDFKKLNDDHGHVFGDIVIRSVAQCIHENARSSDFVVRYGGDEYLLIQANASAASISAFVQRIEKALKTSCQLGINISVTYGFALRSECESPDAVLKLADERLYEKKEAKKVGR